ncbi:hypothetical protein M408DRAFT_211168 [Serendipita vermifera MAFF 305830]|uniref:Phosphatidylethanolamine-binding protein n=1 Tax=Serendipita vermifera MAFF 305830 TaxID=933852 RepID=A0A0C2X875_SERVB|nr:hypothetical protein M408DRAFT_211168 [Serendipita vermifera MAFF 305830]
MPFVLPSQLLSAALKEHDLVPSVVPADFTPSVALDVVFPGRKSFSVGEKLTKEEASQEPQIAFLNVEDIGPDEPSSYTIVFVDPDAPSRQDQKFGQWRHWVQPGLRPPSIQALASLAGGATSDVDIKISEATAQPFATKEKEAATPWRGPGPNPGSGTHRYTFLLFREPKSSDFVIDAQEDLGGGNEFEQRRKWNAMEFAAKKGLTLVGVTFFTVDG